MSDFPVTAAFRLRGTLVDWRNAPVSVNWWNAVRHKVDEVLFAESDFGVIANGRVDNYRALQTAFDTARSTGKTLVLPSGDIGLSQPVVLRTATGLTIRGAGRYGTTIKPLTGFSGTKLIYYDNTQGRIDYCALQGMTLDTTGFNVHPFESNFGGRKNLYRDVIFQSDMASNAASVSIFRDQGASRFDDCEFWADYSGAWAVEFNDENLANIMNACRWAGVGNGMRITHDAAVTFTNAEVSVANDTITITSHGMTTGERFTFTHGGTPPAPLVSGTIYYPIVVDANTIKVATSFDNAAAGTAINLTTVGAGTGTLTFFRHEGFHISTSGGFVTGNTSLQLNSCLDVKMSCCSLDQFNDIGVELEASSDGFKFVNGWIGSDMAATGSNLACVYIHEDAGNHHHFDDLMMTAYSYGFYFKRAGAGNASTGSITNCKLTGYNGTAKSFFYIDSCTGPWLLHGNSDELSSPTAYNGTWELRETDSGSTIDFKDNRVVAKTGGGTLTLTVANSNIRSAGTRGATGSSSPRLDNKGVDDPATAASGSFAHGLGTTPTYGLLTLIQNGTNRFIEIDTIDATNINWKSDNTLNAAAQICWSAEVLKGS